MMMMIQGQGRKWKQYEELKEEIQAENNQAE
jgi:hypothetical protein